MDHLCCQGVWTDFVLNVLAVRDLDLILVVSDESYPASHATCKA
jgi:hypothetical protein